MRIKPINIVILCLSGFLLAMAHADEVTLDAQGKPCEELVDLSETGQFHRLHFECAEKQGAEPAVMEASTLPNVAPVATTSVAVADSAVLTLHIPLDLAKADGVNRAQQQLFQKMVQSCTHGWNKLAESVVQDSQSKQYQLSVQFQCIGR